tara:strand:- start:125 stop:727 length:603 start_codon:yes stop_codon:yes gene_type:complete
MLVDYKYWYFKNAIPKRICNEIIKVAENKTKQIGVTNGYSVEKDLSKLYETRNSNVIWLNTPWIYKYITQYFDTANEKAGWNFSTTIFEDTQYTLYDKDQFYDWHTDGGSIVSESDDINFDNTVRKLSCSILLEDPKNYKGGDFNFKWVEGKNTVEHKAEELDSIGSLIIFPSFLTHKVSPVTEGIRKSLVIWKVGPAFI